MKERLGEISLHLLIAVALVGLSTWLDSPFLGRFLESDLVMLVIALLAINTTTASVIMTKLREISDSNNGAKFPNVVRELQSSIVEQVVLVGFAVLLSIFASSPIVSGTAWVEFLVSSLLTFVLVSAMWNLHDTGQAVFDILAFEQDNSADS